MQQQHEDDCICAHTNNDLRIKTPLRQGELYLVNSQAIIDRIIITVSIFWAINSCQICFTPHWNWWNMAFTKSHKKRTEASSSLSAGMSVEMMMMTTTRNTPKQCHQNFHTSNIANILNSANYYGLVEEILSIMKSNDTSETYQMKT